jgi:DNA-binding response OmpR family regulator
MGQKIETVLVLEDQPLIALDVEEVLFEAGFQNVSIVSSCVEAKDWLKANLPDVAILDISLRDGDCIDIARTLVERAVPFVVHTAHITINSDADSAFLRGKWVEKLSQPGDLVRAVHDLLHHRTGMVSSCTLD